MSQLDALPKTELKKLLLEILTDDNPIENARFPNHNDAVEPWKQSMEKGTFNGRPFSVHTINSYVFYIEGFLKKYHIISYENLEAELLEIPVEQFGKRNKFYRAIMCFAKYLIRENSLPESFIPKGKKIQPKRHKPPRRPVVNEEQINKLFEACRTPYETLILRLLIGTGLRASEFCSLKKGDINFEEGYLVVRNGKWGKRRSVGLASSLLPLLHNHINLYQIQDDDSHLFLDTKFQPLARDGLLNRLYKIGERAGVHVSPHMLRRAFVTINANKGRSLVMLQMACGHSDITTTRSYCQTTEDEVIQAMKEW